MTPPSPTAGDDEAVLALARDWRAAGDRVVLAVVTGVAGSASRGVGSYLAVREDGLFAGSVSGGCVDAAVVAAAEAMAEDDPIRRLDFGIADGPAGDMPLPCGGGLAVALFRPGLDLLEDLVAGARRRETTVVRLDLEQGDARVLRGADAAAAHRLRPAGGRVEDGRVFLRPHDPRIRLVMIGAVHLAQVLGALARHLGFSVIVVDSRRDFATADRFPEVEIRVGPTGPVLDALALDAATAVAALAHLPALDDPALIRALNSPAFYVGALGSRRTHDARRRRLAGLGVAADRLDRLHAPIGLAIGAVTPAEIAVAILAELIAVRRDRSGFASAGAILPCPG